MAGTEVDRRGLTLLRAMAVQRVRRLSFTRLSETEKDDVANDALIAALHGTPAESGQLAAVASYLARGRDRADDAEEKQLNRLLRFIEVAAERMLIKRNKKVRHDVSFEDATDEVEDQGVDVEDHPDNAVFMGELLAELIRAAAEAGEPQGTWFLDHFVKGRGFEDIARDYDENRGSVKRKIYRIWDGLVIRLRALVGVAPPRTDVLHVPEASVVLSGDDDGEDKP